MKTKTTILFVTSILLASDAALKLKTNISIIVLIILIAELVWYICINTRKNKKTRSKN